MGNIYNCSLYMYGKQRRTFLRCLPQHKLVNNTLPCGSPARKMRCPDRVPFTSTFTRRSLSHCHTQRTQRHSGRPCSMRLTRSSWRSTTSYARAKSNATRTKIWAAVPTRLLPDRWPLPAVLDLPPGPGGRCCPPPTGWAAAETTRTRRGRHRRQPQLCGQGDRTRHQPVRSQS